MPDPCRLLRKEIRLTSRCLSRVVRCVLIMPKLVWKFESLPVLLMNDGQDFYKLGLSTHSYGKEILNFKAHILVGIFASENRLREYGTMGIPDYLGRGDLANQYAQFVLFELLPFLKERYPNAQVEKNMGFIGFSLGGLSAFDITLAYPKPFLAAGVFSGSFWWKNFQWQIGYSDDAARIIHKKVRAHKKTEYQFFWFECGTDDEKADRNGNGVIDSIDDTLDLMDALVRTGLPQSHLHYCEVQGGMHDFDTWKKAFPIFMSWWFEVLTKIE